jgi:hypothetical protein
MTAKYIRPTVSAAPPISPLLIPQPPIAPLVPPAHVVDLMTADGSATFGARWKANEAKIVECPALTDSMPEFRTTYDIERDHWIRRRGLADGRTHGTRCKARWRHGVLLLVPHDLDGTGTRRKFRHRRREGGADGEYRRLRGNLGQRGAAAGGWQTQPGHNPGLQHAEPPRAPRYRHTAGDKFEIAIFAINGPISAAPANFLWFREAKVEFFR